MLRLPAIEGATRLVLVRHSAVDESLHGCVYGVLDAPLSANGKDGAEALADWLGGIDFEAVYASPLRRALESARPIAARRSLVPVVHDDLREIDFGELEGERFEDVEASRPALYRSWMHQPMRTRFPGGESYTELRARVLPAVESIRVAHPEATIAIVAHGGVTRIILAAALDLADDALFRLDQSYGGVSVVDWLGDAPLVRLINATCGIAPG